jgi:hypothetical protein
VKAVGTCHQTDKARAASQLHLWFEDTQPATLAMLNDIALFEPSRRGRMAWEAFWQRRGKGLDASDLGLAKAMTGARFAVRARRQASCRRHPPS